MEGSKLIGDWFTTQQIHEHLYLTREEYFYEGNRCNIWLIKGPEKDVIIDTGIGVQDLRQHLESRNLLDPQGGNRPCAVICTHVHFDHCGGAHNFKEHEVFIHEDDRRALLHGTQTETLNYVKAAHFYKEPYPGFSPCRYRVPPTPCMPLKNGDTIDIGQGHHLEIIHVPGHTKGSIMVYYPQKQELFSGDFVYNCGHGTNLLDWLPNSSVTSYVASARQILHWINTVDVKYVYPGHFEITSPALLRTLLHQYIASRSGKCARCCSSCFQLLSWVWILLGCHRCCTC